VTRLTAKKKKNTIKGDRLALGGDASKGHKRSIEAGFPKEGQPQKKERKRKGDPLSKTIEKHNLSQGRQTY